MFRHLVSRLSFFTMASVFCASAALAGSGGFHSRIVGGEEAVRGEFPFIVSLQGSSGHFCGGSLVSKDWVLTAAHCVSSGAPDKVVIGLHNQSQPEGAEVIRPSAVVVHPRSNSETMDYDFALIRLSSESKFAPVALNGEEIRGAADFVTAGWGRTSDGGYKLPDVLQKVTVPFQTPEACAKAYPGQTTDSMICAGLEEGGKDSCQGDSGGPLFLDQPGRGRLLVGVVSWGEGCALPHKYGVYGKVSSAIPWIEETIR